MKKTLAMIVLSLAGLAIAQSDGVKLSPAEQSIANARQELQKKPSQYSGYNHLAIALSRRARETSDVNFYAQAEDALKEVSRTFAEQSGGRKNSRMALAGKARVSGGAGGGQDSQQAHSR